MNTTNTTDRKQTHAADVMRSALESTIPALMRLGDFIGDVDNGGPSGLGKIDRCAIIQQVRDALHDPIQRLDMGGTATGEMEHSPDGDWVPASVAMDIAKRFRESERERCDMLILIRRIKSALGTDEDGDNLVSVAVEAHRAEMENAAIARAEGCD